MRFMLLIYGNAANWDSWSDEERAAVFRTHADLGAELTASGELVGSAGLTALGARTVRVRGGLPAVTDGPYAESGELLAGYYLLDCVDAERAAAVAARLREARHALVEVRELLPADHIARGPATSPGGTPGSAAPGTP